MNENSVIVGTISLDICMLDLIPRKFALNIKGFGPLNICFA